MISIAPESLINQEAKENEKENSEESRYENGNAQQHQRFIVVGGGQLKTISRVHACHIVLNGYVIGWRLIFIKVALMIVDPEEPFEPGSGRHNQ